MGDVLDAVSARIKAPYFGYAVLAFIAWNWRGLFLLVVTDGAAEQRLIAFDMHTSFWSLYVAPLLTGVFVAASAAWIRFFFEYISKKPIAEIELLHLAAEHQRILKKAELEAARSQINTKRELEAIERAKRDEQISKEIKSPEVQLRAQQEIEEIRSKAFTFGSDRDSLSDRDKTLLLIAAADGSGQIYVDQKFVEAGSEVLGNTSPKDFKLFRASVERLLQQKLLERSSNDQHTFELSAQGWAFVDALEKRANTK